MAISVWSLWARTRDEHRLRKETQRVSTLRAGNVDVPEMGDTPNLWWFWPQFCGDFDWEIMIIIGTGGYPVFRQAHLVMPLSVWHPDRVSKGSGRFGRFGRIEKEELRRFKLLKDVKVKVLLVTLELDQHWLHAKKKNRRWRLDTDVRCQEKIGAEGGGWSWGKILSPAEAQIGT